MWITNPAVFYLNATGPKLAPLRFEFIIYRWMGDQYESELKTSPPSLVPSATHI
jgi:hypothetical protein